jgi:uncharacterized membrane protein
MVRLSLNGWYLLVIFTAFMAVPAVSIGAKAEEFEFKASSYYCGKLNGTDVGGGQCRAEYEAYPGDACAVYDNADEKDDGLNSIIAETGSQCSGPQLDEAKTQTLAERANLMGYVSLGYDETVNDPVRNTSMRPGSATYWPQMTYFANECAVQKCGNPDGESPAPQQSVPQEDTTTQCNHENDGVCDVPAICPTGTDVNDCLTQVQPKKAPSVQQSKYTQLTVCSEHYHDLSFAMGTRRRTDDQFWTFQGWWRLSPGECKSMGSHAKGYLYFHAEDSEGHKWGSDKNFCVRNTRFEYLRDGIGTCSKRSEKFKEVYITSDNYKYVFGD